MVLLVDCLTKPAFLESAWLLNLQNSFERNVGICATPDRLAAKTFQDGQHHQMLYRHLGDRLPTSLAGRPGWRYT